MLYNCVHCGECETENERILLKQKYIEDSNTFDEVNEMPTVFKWKWKMEIKAEYQ